MKFPYPASRLVLHLRKDANAKADKSSEMLSLIAQKKLALKKIFVNTDCESNHLSF